MRHRAGVAATLVVVFLAFAPTTVEAAAPSTTAAQNEVLRVNRDVKQIYLNGLEAIDEKRWQAAHDAMQRAIEALSQSSLQTDIFPGTRRNNPIPYFPYFYLGKALFGLGNCSEARQAWRMSIDAGALDEARHQETLRLDTKCSQVLAARQDAEDGIDMAQQTADLLGTLKADDRLAAVWQSNAFLGDDEARGTRALDAARRGLQDAYVMGDLSADQEGVIDDWIRSARRAADDAGRAKAFLDDVTNEARDVLSRLASQTQERPDPAAGTGGGQIETPPDDPAGGADDTAGNEPVGQPERRPEEEARTPVPTAQPSKGGGADPGPGSDTGSRGEAPGTEVPAELLIAATHYFVGNYADANRLLTMTDYPDDSRAQAQVYLLRAAARLALYITGGEEDEALYDQALLDARDGLDIGAIEPSPKYFSPRVVELFRVAREAGR